MAASLHKQDTVVTLSTYPTLQLNRSRQSWATFKVASLRARLCCVAEGGPRTSTIKVLVTLGITCFFK